MSMTDAALLTNDERAAFLLMSHSVPPTEAHRALSPLFAKSIDCTSAQQLYNLAIRSCLLSIF